jgi:hypothetical protein
VRWPPLRTACLLVAAAAACLLGVAARAQSLPQPIGTPIPIDIDGSGGLGGWGTGSGGAGQPAGQPEALFTATSPVLVGQPVTYTNLSYDRTPGDSIVQSLWQGRRPTFTHPGLHLVTLSVEDNTGAWSAPYVLWILVQSPPDEGYPGPVASFSVSSPVQVDQPVTYIDRSYDPDPSAHITGELWTGRRAVFTQPGQYQVSLSVQDSRGLWSPPATQWIKVDPRPDTSADWQVSLTPNPAPLGSTVRVRVTGPASPTLTMSLPAALEATWSGVNYQTLNSAPLASDAPGAWTGTIHVPASPSFPTGSYTVTFVPSTGAPFTASLTVTTSPALIESTVQASW